MRQQLFVLIIVAIVATACGTTARPEVDQAPVEPEVEQVISETVAEDSAPAANVGDWLASVGRTEDGLMYLGNPEAPITMTDYSDFM